VIEGEMKELKTYLYARFGTSINLEEGAPWCNNSFVLIFKQYQV
jgi:hypothetical protein